MNDGDDLISITTTVTVRRPQSSTVPNSALGYSTTTIDGELILCRLTYRVNGLYRVGKILPSIVLILLHDTATIDTATIDTATTTVRRPQSSTVPNPASGYSTTTIDGELILC
jgi:hypothetical protein